jgi:hypothetical protein
LKKCKKDSDDYDDYHDYMKAYIKWKKDMKLTVAEHTMLGNADYHKPPEVPRPTPLLIVDDMSHSEIYSNSLEQTLGELLSVKDCNALNGLQKISTVFYLFPLALNFFQSNYLPF